MQKNIQVVLADDNKDFADILAEYINSQDDFEVVGVAIDGLTAVNIVIANEPDVVILDIIMPRLDGIGVLERIKSTHLRKRPVFIILSSVGQEKITHNALTLGAEYYFLKPFDMEMLVSRIRQFYSDELSSKTLSYLKNKVPSEEKDISQVVTNILHELGMPPHLKGYNFLRESILLVAEDFNRINAITKYLFPTIAHQFNTTPGRVDRAIRHALKVSWQRADLTRFDSLFGYTVSNRIDSPTCSEIIAAVADKVRLQLKDSNISS